MIMNEWVNLSATIVQVNLSYLSYLTIHCDFVSLSRYTCEFEVMPLHASLMMQCETIFTLIDPQTQHTVLLSLNWLFREMYMICLFFRSDFQ